MFCNKQPYIKRQYREEIANCWNNIYVMHLHNYIFLRYLIQ